MLPVRSTCPRYASKEWIPVRLSIYIWDGSSWENVDRSFPLGLIVSASFRNAWLNNVTVFQPRYVEVGRAIWRTSTVVCSGGEWFPPTLLYLPMTRNAWMNTSPAFNPNIWRELFRYLTTQRPYDHSFSWDGWRRWWWFFWDLRHTFFSMASRRSHREKIPPSFYE